MNQEVSKIEGIACIHDTTNKPTEIVVGFDYENTAIGFIFENEEELKKIREKDFDILQNYLKRNAGVPLISKVKHICLASADIKNFKNIINLIKQIK